MPTLNFSDNLKIWFGKRMPKGLINRLCEQAEQTKITLLINKEILENLYKDDLDSPLLDLVDAINIDALPINNVPTTAQEALLLNVVRTLVALGMEYNEPRAYALASDITRWLPCFIATPKDKRTFKVYSDTDVIYIKGQLPEKMPLLDKEPGVFAQMFTGSSYIPSIDFGFIQLPEGSELPEKIMAQYYAIFSTMSESTLRELIKHDSCGGIMQLRAHPSTDPELAFIYKQNLDAKELSKLTCEQRYAEFVSNLNERSWQRPIASQTFLYQNHNGAIRYLDSPSEEDPYTSEDESGKSPLCPG